MLRHGLWLGVSMLAVSAAACGVGPSGAGEGSAIDAPVGKSAQALDAACGHRGCNSASVNLNIVRPDPASTPSEVYDTQLLESSPDTPQDPSAVEIGVGSSSGEESYSLVQFDLSGLPSGAALAALNGTGVNVVSAYGVLTTESDVPTGGTVNVHNVTSAWSQATATWDNAPSWDSDVAESFSIPDGTAAETTLPSFDMTALAGAWVAGTPNYGVLLEEPGASGASFFDSESSDFYQRPQLTIIYTVRCADGYQDCNDDGADGCETNLNGDPDNCGSCGAACTAPANAVATCDAGACGFSCDAGYDDCGGVCTGVTSDVNNCGGCGVVCPAPVGGSATCSNGTCGAACPGGETDCSGTCRSLGSDTNNCGACGHVCPGGDSCENGTCVAPVCNNPGGTYAETCYGCTQNGDILSCSCCLTRDQECNATSFNVCTCGFNISNCNGVLECNEC